jgi:hypothetical protein
MAPEVKGEEVPLARLNPKNAANPLAVKRAKMITDYRSTMVRAGHPRPTKVSIWREANYGDRTEFQRWQAGKLPDGGEADKRFKKVLKRTTELGPI